MKKTFIVIGLALVLGLTGCFQQNTNEKEKSESESEETVIEKSQDQKDEEAPAEESDRKPADELDGESDIKPVNEPEEQPADEPEEQPAEDTAEESETRVKSFTMTARQWDFEPAVVTVNEGDTVRLTITSVDVAHGFALPDFGVSRRLEPGQTVNIEFVADKKGTFGFFCNVFCGSDHSDMRGRLIVN